MSPNMSIVQVITKLYLEVNKLEVLGSVSDHRLLLQQQVPSLKFSHLSQHTNGPSSPFCKTGKDPKASKSGNLGDRASNSQGVM